LKMKLVKLLTTYPEEVFVKWMTVAGVTTLVMALIFLSLTLMVIGGLLLIAMPYVENAITWAYYNRYE
jgi:hypothetical protein